MDLSMTSLSSTGESGWTSYIDHFFETDEKQYEINAPKSSSNSFSSSKKNKRKKNERFMRKRERANNLESDDDDSLEDTASSPLTSYPHQQPYDSTTLNLDQKKIHDILKVTKEMKTECGSGSTEREESVSDLSLDLDLGLGNRMYNIESTEMKKRRLLFSNAYLYGF